METRMGSFETKERIAYGLNENNGLILNDKYIPEELLEQLLCYIDYTSLLNCQLVCKKWKDIIQCYIWKRKAEMRCEKSLQCLKTMPWHVFYNICRKNPFHRNLIKNHSGEHGVKKHWRIISQGGDHWKVENPPEGVPQLPDDALFASTNYNNNSSSQFCFVTSYATCSKQQIVDLETEGLSSYLLDNYQPVIQVGEWFSSRWDCPAVYSCSVTLLDNDNKILDSYEISERLKDEKQMVWLYFTHEFKDYGPGLRKIKFRHSGKDSLFWAGHYGSKMARASIVVKLNSETKDDKSNISSTNEQNS